MQEYTVKVGFWLRAYDSFTLHAASDAKAIEGAKLNAASMMETTLPPEHIDIDERREGLIVLIECRTPEGRRSVVHDVEFDDDRIGPPIAC